MVHKAVEVVLEVLEVGIKELMVIVEGFISLEVDVVGPMLSLKILGRGLWCIYYKYYPSLPLSFYSSFWPWYIFSYVFIYFPLVLMLYMSPCYAYSCIYPVSDYLVVDWLYQSCIVTFSEKETWIYLIILDMVDFDVISGRDMLSNYYVIFIIFQDRDLNYSGYLKVRLKGYSQLMSKGSYILCTCSSRSR